MYHQLTSEQRYALNVMLHQKQTKTAIAAALGVDRSTIYRELKRNGGKRGGYNKEQAQAKANLRRQRLHLPRTYTPGLRREVHALLRKYWSPKQISGWLLKTKGIKVSHETIYADIRADRLVGGDLWKCCRHRMKHRKRHVGKWIPIPNRVGIELRPPEADGTRVGDFEIDTVIGKDGQGVLLTITDRKTNYSMVVRLPKGKDAKALAKEVVRLLTPFIGHISSITTDNGTEFACHEYIAKMLHTTVYFTHPYSAWEKGAIENYNKLLRQYIPKKADFDDYTDEQIMKIQKEINERPREKLNFATPKAEFYRHFK